MESAFPRFGDSTETPEGLFDAGLGTLKKANTTGEQSAFGLRILSNKSTLQGNKIVWFLVMGQLHRL